jgi:hypothetical protein
MPLTPKDTPHRYPLTNPSTGALLTDQQKTYLDNIETAKVALFEAMHQAEGSINPGENQEHVFTTRRMNIAKTHIETACLFAREEAMGS